MQMEYDIDQVSVGNRLRMERASINVSQEKLSAVIGCSTKYLSSLECGRAVPSIQFLMKFSDITGASLDYLMYGVHPRHKRVASCEAREEMHHYGYENSMAGLNKRQRNFMTQVIPKITEVLKNTIG
jgi:transcriptional regulator with XRE-family HTH domain